MTRAEDPPAEERVDDLPVPGKEDGDLAPLLARALEILGEGGQVNLEELCADRPDLIGELGELLGIASKVDTATGSTPNPGEVAGGLNGRLLDGRYRLLRRLGSGAMGAVYLAEDSELGRRVAIKLLHGHLLGGPSAVERFQREAEVLASLHHPGIVTVYDRGHAPEGRYLVLELLEGESLADLVEVAAKQVRSSAAVTEAQLRRWLGPEAVRESQFVRAAVRWAYEVSQSLIVAHDQGILHRDVKPSNIFVRSTGEAVLLDFGIAGGEGHATLTRDGTALGTPAYMAPECLSSDSRLDPAVDVYGLTASLFHLVTLRAPYEGTPTQVLLSLATTQPPRAAKLSPGLHRDLSAILERGLARRPEDRYASAGELGLDLLAFLEHRPVSARPSTWIGRGWRRARGSRSLQTAAAMAAAGLILAGVLRTRTLAAAERAERYSEAYAKVPGHLGLGLPEMRFVPNVPARTQIDQTLQNVVAADPSRVQARLVSASFALDHGQVDQAIEHVQAVASQISGTYGKALLGIYRELAPGTRGALELDLSSLPEPTLPLERYLTAYHLRRQDPYADVSELLSVEELADHAPSQELLILQHILGGDFESASRLASRWIDSQGNLTASAAHWLGLIAVLERRYAAAIEILDDGLRLAPNDHGMLINAARSKWVLGRFEEAREHLEHALLLKPGRLDTHDSLARVLLADGRFDDARAVVQAAPYGPGEEGLRASLLGEIEAERALDLWSQDDRQGANAAAEESTALFHAAAELGGPHEISRAKIAESLRTGSTDSVFSSIANLLAEEPLNRRRVEILLDWMPTDLSPAESAALSQFLRSQQAELSAGQRP